MKSLVKLFQSFPPGHAVALSAFMWCFASGPAFSRTYVCGTVEPDGTCSAYVEVIESLRTLDGVGLTTEVMVLTVAWGIGTVLVFFSLGLGLGAGHRVLKMALGGQDNVRS